MTKRERVLDFLKYACEGRENARDSRSLEKAAHISRSELQRCVNRMRREGVPIGSCQQGYYYAITADEIYDTIRQLQQMESGLKAAISGLVGALKGFTGSNPK